MTTPLLRKIDVIFPALQADFGLESPTAQVALLEEAERVTDRLDRAFARDELSKARSIADRFNEEVEVVDPVELFAHAASEALVERDSGAARVFRKAAGSEQLFAYKSKAHPVACGHMELVYDEQDGEYHNRFKIVGYR
jgi:hypothetical protein